MIVELSWRLCDSRQIASVEPISSTFARGYHRSLRLLQDQPNLACKPETTNANDDSVTRHAFVTKSNLKLRCCARLRRGKFYRVARNHQQVV